MRVKKHVIAGLVLVASLSAQAGDGVDPIFREIDVLSYSITQSSVAERFSDKERQSKLALVERARREAQQGDIKSAKGLLDQAARRLYPVSKTKRDYPRRDWFEARHAALQSLLPVARDIAREKGASTLALDLAVDAKALSEMAAELGDWKSADMMLDSAYRSMKLAVAELRAGDRLVIPLPDPDSRAGWIDAEQRYQDWRYFHNMVLLEAEDSLVDISVIEDAETRADRLYRQAAAMAEAEYWAEAVSTMDEVFRIIEQSWKDIGLRVGI